ncbi:unnamed protein product, partial [Mesorhabditis belari]|uniref:Uncharacterized protein n=1 Tax=Mesorhabditis belari TaxID=2138241 RepID=A0AAF3FF34_9BILA
MLLECYNQDVPYGILVNVEAGFEDVLMLGRFVEKLSSVAGYQQVRVDEDNLSANTSCGSEYEDEIDEENDDANPDLSTQSEDLCWQSQAKKMSRDRPILMFVEGTTRLSFFFGAGYFEVTHTPSDTLYRFEYIPGVNREYEAQPEDFGRPGKKRFTYLVRNVMLQSPHNPNNVQRVLELRNRVVLPRGPFVDLAEVDVFVDLGASSHDVFHCGIVQENFTPI